jgi:hypothetical protein
MSFLLHVKILDSVCCGSQSCEECIEFTVEKMETIEKHLELQETLMSLAMKNSLTENGSSFDNFLEVILKFIIFE